MTRARVFHWTFEPVDNFPACEAEWNLLNRCSNNTPLLDHSLVLALLQEFGSGDELVARCRDDDELVAMAVLKRFAFGRWQTFQPSQGPLGAWNQMTGVTQEGLLRSLVTELPGVALVAGISQQDPDLLNRPVTSRHLSTKDYIETARITVADSFDSYWAARGKNLRQNMKRQRSRLIRDHVTSRLVVLTRPDDIAAAVDNFGLLESRGWKAGTGTAVHPDNAQGRFYRKIMVGFAARGEACVAQYFFGERLVACDLCVNRNGVFIVLKTTYDESEKDTSPAMLMRQELFQQLFAASTWRRIEFYGRVMEWHRRWSDEVRVMYHTTYYRWPWLAALMRRRSTPAGLRADVQPAT